MLPRSPDHLTGFTLIEVLVALAVIAIALAAAVRATIGVVDGTDSLKRHLAAGWVAQNRLNWYMARSEFPDVGHREGKEQQAGIEYIWHEEISSTFNSSFRRVEVKVYSQQPGQHADAVLIGFIANVPR